LSDDDNGLTGLRVQFIGSLSLKIVLNNSINHGALALESRHSESAVLGKGGVGKTVGESRVVGQIAGTPTIPLVFADNLKKGDGHEPPRTRDQRIARFVPI
jgi:hypothetical protein